MSKPFNQATGAEITLNQLIDEMIRLAKPDQVQFKIDELINTHLIPELTLTITVEVIDVDKFKQYLNAHTDHFFIVRSQNRYSIYHSFVNQLRNSGQWIQIEPAGLKILDTELHNY